MLLVNYSDPGWLLKAVKASLILSDSSLSDWSKKNGVQRQNLTKALCGDWTGPKADRLVAKITEELRVKLPE